VDGPREFIVKVVALASGGYVRFELEEKGCFEGARSL
jgi:hypothetical protein